MKTNKHAPVGITKEDAQQMQELRDDGFTLTTIAEKFDITSSMVSYYTISPNNISVYSMRFLNEMDTSFGVTRDKKVIGYFIPKTPENTQILKENNLIT